MMLPPHQARVFARLARWQLDLKRVTFCSYCNRTANYPYGDGTMYTQQAVTTYIEAPHQQASFTSVSAPTAVVTANTPTGQSYMQVSANQLQASHRHGPIHTTRASPATVSLVLIRLYCLRLIVISANFHTFQLLNTIIFHLSVSFQHFLSTQVQWLLDNYETAEGVSLPRSTLYSHYLAHCQANKLDAVNAASFGKLIRSVFLGLRTRRLGTR